MLRFLLDLLLLHVLLELPGLLQLPGLTGLLLVHMPWAPGRGQWSLRSCFLLSPVLEVGPVLLALLWLLELVLLRLLGLPWLLLVSEIWSPGLCLGFLVRSFLLFPDFQVHSETCCLPSLWGSDQGLQADWLLVLLVLHVQLVLGLGAYHCLSHCRVMGPRG